MDHNAVFLVVCFLIAEAYVAAAAIHYSTWKPSSHSHHHYWEDGLDHHSHFVMNQRMLKEAESISSIGRHDKRDLEALLSFRRAITADPHGLLSNWTAQNSANICSWYGISCRKHSRRVVAISLSTSQLEGTLSPSLGNLSLLHSLFLMTIT
jgi:hypothetical protein